MTAYPTRRAAATPRPRPATVTEAAEACRLDPRPRNTYSPCPACRATRIYRNDARGPVIVDYDATRWRCARCEAAGSPADLVAACHPALLLEVA